MMSQILYIAVDDTDTPAPPGTGKVARGLAENLEQLGLGVSLGVTRHQLLVDRRIGYTSQNSSKCITMSTTKPLQDFYSPCVRYVEAHHQEGSDPGVCICPSKHANKAVAEFGKKAATVIVKKADALILAQRNGIFLRELGGTGEGVIGALAGAGLRAEGNNGRFIELRGIRDVKGIISVNDLLKRTGIVFVQDPLGRNLSAKELVDSRDWIRPSLVGGEAVLLVKEDPDSSDGRFWIPAVKRNKDKSAGEDE